MKVNLAELRTLALKATRGPRYISDNDGDIIAGFPNHRSIGHVDFKTEVDTTYTIATDPGTILQLIDAIDRMKPIYDAALVHRQLHLQTGQRSTKLDEVVDKELATLAVKY